MNWLYADCGDEITTAGDLDERSICPTLPLVLPAVVFDDGCVKSTGGGLFTHQRTVIIFQAFFFFFQKLSLLSWLNYCTQRSTKSILRLEKHYLKLVISTSNLENSSL